METTSSRPLRATGSPLTVVFSVPVSSSAWCQWARLRVGPGVDVVAGRRSIAPRAMTQGRHWCRAAGGAAGGDRHPGAFGQAQATAMVAGPAAMPWVVISR